MTAYFSLPKLFARPGILHVPSSKENSKSKLLTTGDMARLSGNTLRTVRFYEEAGLVRPHQRTDGGHRLFEATELDKMRLVTELRAAGLSLEDIRSMLEIKKNSATGDEAATDVLERLDNQIDIMNARIDLLSKLRGELERTRGHLAACVGCKDKQHFPNLCGDCEVMASAQTITKAVSVLWNVEKGRSGDD